MRPREGVPDGVEGLGGTVPTWGFLEKTGQRRRVQGSEVGNRKRETGESGPNLALGRCVFRRWSTFCFRVGEFMFKAGTDCALGWSESCFSFSVKNRREPGISTAICLFVYLVHQYKSRKAPKYRKGRSIQAILSVNGTDRRERND